MADGELALDLEADDKKEQGQEPLVDPMLKRQRKGETAEREAELLVPERG